MKIVRSIKGMLFSVYGQWPSGEHFSLSDQMIMVVAMRTSVATLLIECGRRGLWGILSQK